MGLIEPGQLHLFLLAMTTVPAKCGFQLPTPFIQSLLGRFFQRSPSVLCMGRRYVGHRGHVDLPSGTGADWNMGLGNSLCCYSAMAGVNQLLTRRVMKTERALLPITACQMTTASLVTLGFCGLIKKFFCFLP